MAIDIDFLGAAGTVTGSCHRVRHPGGMFLVDCGMFQGSKTLRALNYGPLPVDPGRVGFLALTHAHIDHSGLIPKLVRGGFRGPVLATEGTRELLTYLLPDSGAIQEQEVEHLNRRNRQRGLGEIAPIYGLDDAREALARIRPVAYDRWITAPGGVRLRWWNAGHILGSASIEAEVPTGEADRPVLRLLFSGDIGPEHKLFHPDPEAPAGLDALVVEGTYGDRDRLDVGPAERRRLLAAEITAAFAEGGMLLIPAFAVERTQELLFDLGALYASGAVPRAPIFVDSPLATAATQAFRHSAEGLEDLPKGADPFRMPDLRFVETVEQSKAIDRLSGRAIVIAGSGMCDAGRIRFHLRARLWRPDTTVLFVGYQAPGTLGRVLLEGAGSVRIQGEEVRVKARLRRFEHYSGHADRAGLVRWIAGRMPVRLATYLVHGEPAALDSLAAALRAGGQGGDRIYIPGLDDTARLPDAPAPRRAADARPAPGEAARDDWHNQYARLLLELKPALERLPDDDARRERLTQLRRNLISS